MRYWDGTRESSVGRVPRRERRPYPQWSVEEQATPADAQKRSRPQGCTAFWLGRRCSSVTDRSGSAPSSRLAQTENQQQRGPSQYFKRLLAAGGAVLALNGRLKCASNPKRATTNATKRSAFNRKLSPKCAAPGPRFEIPRSAIKSRLRRLPPIRDSRIAQSFPVTTTRAS